MHDDYDGVGVFRGCLWVLTLYVATVILATWIVYGLIYLIVR